MRRKGILLPASLLLAVFLFGALTLSGCSNNGTAPATGSISGTVYRSGTVRPVADVLVEIAGKWTLTSEHGTYHIVNIPTGTHELIASKEHYEYFKTRVVITGDETHDIELRTVKDGDPGDPEG